MLFTACNGHMRIPDLWLILGPVLGCWVAPSGLSRALGDLGPHEDHMWAIFRLHGRDPGH